MTFFFSCHTHLIFAQEESSCTQACVHTLTGIKDAGHSHWTLFLRSCQLLVTLVAGWYHWFLRCLSRKCICKWWILPNLKCIDDKRNILCPKVGFIKYMEASSELVFYLIGKPLSLWMQLCMCNFHQSRAILSFCLELAFFSMRTFLQTYLRLSCYILYG